MAVASRRAVAAAGRWSIDLAEALAHAELAEDVVKLSLAAWMGEARVNTKARIKMVEHAVC